MSRYFLELSYLGTHYSGFQAQENANTVQAEVEKALKIFLRADIGLTGSSRTDSGVHARQNFFHFDFAAPIPEGFLYHVNAILPADIALKGLFPVSREAHCRFGAISREYEYVLYSRKDPFLDDRAWFYPYPLDGRMLQEAAAIVAETRDFSSFAKKRGQAGTPFCEIMESRWVQTQQGWTYQVRGNRFLRGMVRGLVGTMLQAGRRKINIGGFRAILQSGENTRADFTAPGKGLCLMRVTYPEGYLRADG
jgi:tRNA pseudouridine38-40 synthase